jgi:hypothetical protein
MQTTVAQKARLLILVPLLLIGAARPTVSAEASCCGPITVRGRQLLSVLDGMNVESLWLAHEHTMLLNFFDYLKRRIPAK